MELRVPFNHLFDYTVDGHLTVRHRPVRIGEVYLGPGASMNAASVNLLGKNIKELAGKDLQCNRTNDGVFEIISYYA